MKSPDFRTMLRDELRARQARNARYSLRAFARDLALSPARLSEVLSGGRLSAARAAVVAERMRLSGAERDWFTALVERESPYATTRERGVARARRVERQLSYSKLDEEAFNVIAEWHHVGLLELIATERFQPEPTWIGARLGVSAEAASAALVRLAGLGLIKKTRETYVRTKAKLTTESPVPSRAIRSFHSQLLGRAEKALYEQAIERRSFDSLVFAVAESDIAPAKAALAEFAKEFTARFRAEPEGRERVYALCMQLFELTEEVPCGSSSR